jgi:hypothetical protein
MHPNRSLVPSTRFAAVLRSLRRALGAVSYVARAAGDGYRPVAALFQVPADYQQGDSFRILYIHVPSAWMSMFVFGLMAFYAAIALVWRIKLCEILAMACAPIGRRLHRDHPGSPVRSGASRCGAPGGTGIRA